MSLIYEGWGREGVVGVERLASGWTIRSSKPDGGFSPQTFRPALRPAQPPL